MFCYPLAKIYSELVNHLTPVPYCLTFFIRVNYHKIQQLEQSVVCWKRAFIFCCFSYDTIETFNRVGGINNFSYLTGVLEKRRQQFPVIAPAFHSISVLAAPN